MTTREQLVEALGQLDPAEFEEVVNAAYRRRHVATSPAAERPDPGANRDEFARWLAQRHLSSDAAIAHAVYLPGAAPKDEVRLLEVNRFLNPPDNDAIEPLDFTPDIDGIPFKVFVADVTADQWERAKSGGGTSLPRGWKLDGHQIVSRD